MRRQLKIALLGEAGNPQPDPGAAILAWDDSVSVQELIQWDDASGNPQFLEWDV